LIAAEPGNFAPIPGAPQEALSLASKLVAQGRTEAAIATYAHHLEHSALTEALRSDFQVALAATLCLLAQQEPAQATAILHLDAARQLISEACTYRTRLAHPHAWAVARANLAAIHLARGALSDDIGDVMSAHLALDGTEAVFSEHQDEAGSDWVQAMRDALLEQRNRRTSGR
jgi:maltooligosyltrehalose synthase